MKKLTPKECLDLQFDILKAFDAFCRQHGLRYMLAYGTLIGAIRHKGFIPWDDDIDVMMPFPDYQKMIDIVNELGTNGIVDGRYRFACPGIKSDIPYHNSFCKVYDNRTVASKSTLRKELGFKEGVFIDVFFLCGMPEEDAERKVERLRKADSMLFYKSRAKQPGDINLRYPRTAFRTWKKYREADSKPFQTWVDEYLDALNEFPPADGAKIARSFAGWFMSFPGDAFDDNPFDEIIEAPFEDIMLPIPAKYDYILTHQYGDYMKLPPEEKRHATHDQGYYIEE